jgi:histidinol phosphatase-like enzyme
MSKIKELEKEITNNLFQLNKDELELIVLHIQSLINKKYMGEEVNLFDVYMRIEQMDKRLQQMDEDLVSVIYDRGIKDGR